MFDLIPTISTDVALLFVRIVLGGLMIYHGWPKIKNLRQNAQDFTGMGFRPGVFWGTIVAFVEFFGGIAILLGIFAELAALLIGTEMIVGAIWKARGGKKLSDYGYDITLLTLCVVILSFGVGPSVLTL